MKISRTLLILPILIISAVSLASGADRDSRRRGRAHFRSRPQLERSMHANGRHRNGRHEHRALACGCIQAWREGHYRTYFETIREPGYYKQVWVPRRAHGELHVGRHFSLSLGGGRGYYEQVWVPGCIRKELRRVWVPGSFEIRTRCRTHAH